MASLAAATGRACRVLAALALLQCAPPAPPYGTWGPGRADAAGWVQGWGAGGLRARFSGRAIAARMQDLAPAPRWHNVYAAYVDDRPPVVFSLSPQLDTYALAQDLLPGLHTLLLVRRTEASVGPTRIAELLLPAGASWLPPPLPAPRRLTVVGDSISAGYGNAGAGPHCRYSPATQLGELAFGPRAARALGAEISVLAWSGRGLWRNRDGSQIDTLPQLYGRALPGDAEVDAPWLAQAPPDAVVVNLGTNDFAAGALPGTVFTDAAVAFLGQLRRLHPQAHLLWTLGPMLSDRAPAGVQQLTQARAAMRAAVAARQAAGDANVAWLEFPEQTGSLGYGCDWHPSLATHAQMAAQLQAHLGLQLGWTRTP